MMQEVRFGLLYAICPVCARLFMTAFFPQNFPFGRPPSLAFHTVCWQVTIFFFAVWIRM